MSLYGVLKFGPDTIERVEKGKTTHILTDVPEAKDATLP